MTKPNFYDYKPLIDKDAIVPKLHGVVVGTLKLVELQS